MAGSREAVWEQHEVTDHQSSETDQKSEPDPDIDMGAWRKAARGRQLRVLISGLGGAGKSTLINQLLRLKEDNERAKEGKGGATTLVVSKHERTTEKGMKVCLFDTPGFGDPDIEDEDIIAMMERETEKRLDVVFYCISLSDPCRLQRADVQAIKIMTQAFTGDIWNKAVIVLTFANALEAKVANKAEYKATITQIQEKVRQVLRKDPLISAEVIAQLPIVTAGHSGRILKYESDECKSLGGWDNRLFLKALEQVDPAVVPTLLEVRYNWRETDSIFYTTINSTFLGDPLSFSMGLPYVFIVTIIQVLKLKYRQWQMRR